MFLSANNVVGCAVVSELQLSEPCEKTTRMTMLHDKLVSLGQIYAAASGKYFPLG